MKKLKDKFNKEQRKFILGQLEMMAHEIGDYHGWDCKGYKTMLRFNKEIEKEFKK